MRTGASAAAPQSNLVIAQGMQLVIESMASALLTNIPLSRFLAPYPFNE